MQMSVKCVRFRTRLWLVVAVVSVAVVEVMALSGSNVCMVKQKYNITKRIKYRAPTVVRSYVWCFAMPPRCSQWTTEMKDLTKLETEERTAEVAVCCPGYKMKDVSCVPICPNGKTGPKCSEDCQPNWWGPNCVHECKECSGHGSCSPLTGECVCHDGWQGESCERVSTPTTSTTPAGELLTTSKAATKPSSPTTASTLITTPRSTSTAAPTTTPITTSLTTQSSTSTIATTVKIPIKPQIPLPKTKEVEKTTTNPSVVTTEIFTSTYNPTTLEMEKHATTEMFRKETKKTVAENGSINNRTVLPVTTKSTYTTEIMHLTTQSTTTVPTTTEAKPNYIVIKNQPIETTTIKPKTTVPLTTKEVQHTTTAKAETTRKPETTIKIFPTTMKFKPKEIWIRPAQKGESSITDIKTKQSHEAPIKYKNATKIEILPNTTPKTIIVSIIPTSVSYATFKKIALSTASYMSSKNTTVVRTYSKSEGVTKPMSIQTSTVTPSPKTYNSTSLKSIHFTTTLSTSTVKSVSKTAPNLSSLSTSTMSTATPTSTTRRSSTKSVSVNNITNSMTRTTNAVTAKPNYSNTLTTVTIPSSKLTQSPHRNVTAPSTTSKPISTTLKTVVPLNKSLDAKRHVTTERRKELTLTTVTTKTEKKEVDRTNDTKITVANSANSKTNSTVTVTTKPQDEETFHILTEPEHITAVMSEKGTERSSVDLISVISIAGGVMMAVITVAVIIVMMERCKRPRYEDVRKINDIRMQVMIENNDVPPPPYVRSIFHTPLPDPPNIEKCHYQPISTLDRNLKQFMRPVVVQTISPIMLENFRGILECHYDHLPRRSHEFGPQPAHCLIAPSIDSSEQLSLHRASLTESAIDALKCEAKQDIIDTTTSEPLYAEIPCWRPPSEHAIEIMNLNGEAVTEL